MKKLKTNVFSAIVILINSFSDEAESKSLEMDRRLERAAEAWSNGTSLAQADTDTSDSDGGIEISRREADNADAVTGMVTGSKRQAYFFQDLAQETDPETGINYGCYWSKCWRSCKKGEQDPSGYYKERTIISTIGSHTIKEWHEFCQNDKWCYSDLGPCSANGGCQEAVKWGCYGTGREPGRMVKGDDAPCPVRGQYCDTKTERSFGCDDHKTRCWRTCDEEEDYCFKRGYGVPTCIVDSGDCSYDHRCIVATVLKCHYHNLPG